MTASHADEAAARLVEFDSLAQRAAHRDAVVLATPIAAMAHATLALAEQQHIANLLALGQFHWSEPNGDGLRTTLSLTLAAATDALNEAQKLLGLEPEENDRA